MLTHVLTATSLVLLAPLAARAQAGVPRVVVSEAGAVSDGTTPNTRAIQKTIDQLAGRGGGAVVVPAGKFLTAFP
jgi:polygalacturonase